MEITKEVALGKATTGDRPVRKNLLVCRAQVKTLALGYAMKHRSGFDRVSDKFVQRLNGRVRDWIEEICDSRKKPVVMFDDDPLANEDLKSGTKYIIERGVNTKLIAKTYVIKRAKKALGSRSMPVTQKQMIDIIATKTRRFVEMETRSQPSIGKTIM